MNRLIPITIIVPVEKLGLSYKLSEGYHDNEDLFELTIDVPFDESILDEVIIEIIRGKE